MHVKGAPREKRQLQIRIQLSNRMYFSSIFHYISMVQQTLVKFFKTQNPFFASGRFLI